MIRILGPSRALRAAIARGIWERSERDAPFLGPLLLKNIIERGMFQAIVDAAFAAGLRAAQAVPPPAAPLMLPPSWPVWLTVDQETPRRFVLRCEGCRAVRVFSLVGGHLLDAERDAGLLMASQMFPHDVPCRVVDRLHMSGSARWN